MTKRTAAANDYNYKNNVNFINGDKSVVQSSRKHKTASSNIQQKSSQLAIERFGCVSPQNTFLRREGIYINAHICMFISRIFCLRWKLRRIFLNLFKILHRGWPRRWRSGLERSPRKRKVGCSNPGRKRPKSLKQIVTAPLPNARHQV